MNRISGRFRKVTAAVLLVLATAAIGMAIHLRAPRQAIRSIAGAVDFQQALRIYSGFVSGLDAKEIRDRHRIRVNVETEAEALEQVIALQSKRSSIPLGAAPEGSWNLEHSGLSDEDRGDLLLSALSHRNKSFHSVSNPLARLNASSFLLWEEPRLLAGERCWLTPACMAAHSRWSARQGRSAFQREKDRRDLRDICRGQADWILGELDRTGWGGDYLADFSICRKAADPEPPLLCTTMRGTLLTSPDLLLHPSCLDDAADEMQFELKRARFDQIHDVAGTILDGCPLREDPDSRPVLEALPSSRYGGPFVLLTCFEEGNRITDGQRGLLNFEDGLLAQMRPNRFVYVRKETYEEPASWPLSGMQTRTREVQVKTQDPEEIRAHGAKVERVQDMVLSPTRQEADAIAAYVSLLTVDAIRNQPDRFRKRNQPEIPQAVAETLGRIWSLDCMRGRPNGGRFLEAALRLPGSEAALDRCKKGDLPALPDPHQNRAVQLACERLKKAGAE